MVQADMPYFMGNGPEDFILRGAVIVADNESLRRFAPQYKAVFVIVRLQVRNILMNPCRKISVAKKNPAVLRDDSAGIDRKRSNTLFKQKSHCQHIIDSLPLHPVFVLFAFGG